MTIQDIQADLLTHINTVYADAVQHQLHSPLKPKIIEFVQTEEIIHDFLTTAIENGKKPPPSFYKALIKLLDQGFAKGDKRLVIKANLADKLRVYYTKKYLHHDDETYAQTALGFFDSEITLKYDNRYTFNPNNQISIWFSKNPREALPAHVQTALETRRNNLPKASIKLLYARHLLSSNAYWALRSFAVKHQIYLINFDMLYIKNRSLNARILEELQFKKYGNPAAASDLCRWIPEIFHNVVYLDIDLPIDTQLMALNKLKKFQGGMPIMFNMGSLISKRKPETGRQEEAISLNTDIIGYCDSKKFGVGSERELMMKKIAQFIVACYKKPSVALKASNITKTNYHISKTAFFEKTLRVIQATGIEKPIFYYRKALLDAFDSQSLKKIMCFLGHACVKEALKLTEAKTQVLFNLLETEEEVATDYLIDTLSLENSEVLNSKLNEIAVHLYKTLVMEISGPGAVYQVLGGTEVLTQTYRTGAESTGLVARSLEAFLSLTGQSGFTSTNIPAWQTPEQNQAEYNTDGLSWCPCRST
ncbi:MAG: glycosyltransferase family 88 protein [Legionellaceae bacterium]|nr:glycosyltransferase family 88 protein [Legionellaceae bacterium]